MAWIHREYRNFDHHSPLKIMSGFWHRKQPSRARLWPLCLLIMQPYYRGAFSTYSLRAPFCQRNYVSFFNPSNNRDSDIRDESMKSESLIIIGIPT